MDPDSRRGSGLLFLGSGVLGGRGRGAARQFGEGAMLGVDADLAAGELDSDGGRAVRLGADDADDAEPLRQQEDERIESQEALARTLGARHFEIGTRGRC